AHRQMPRGKVPHVVLADLVDADWEVGELRGWLEGRFPGAKVGLIAAAGRHRLPVLAGNEVDDVVELAAGPEEVVYRMRRIVKCRRAGSPVISVGELTLSSRDGLATIAGEPTLLRPREMELLSFLASHPNRVFGREALV